jgi:hypothetical protein
MEKALKYRKEIESFWENKTKVKDEKKDFIY